MKTTINNSNRYKQHILNSYCLLVSHKKMTIYMHIYIKPVLAERLHLKVHVKKDDNEKLSSTKITKERGKCYRTIYTENVLLEDLTTSAQWSELHFKFLLNVSL